MCMRMYEVVDIENQNICFKVDTGAQVNILPKNIYNKLSQNCTLEHTKLVLETFRGFKITPLGVVHLNCTYKNVKRELTFVVENNDMPILGLISCIDLKIVNRVESIGILPTAIEQFVKTNNDIFTGLGKFQQKCKVQLKKDAKPIARPPRRVSLAIKIS